MYIYPYIAISVYLDNRIFSPIILNFASREYMYKGSLSLNSMNLSRGLGRDLSRELLVPLRDVPLSRYSRIVRNYTVDEERAYPRAIIEFRGAFAREDLWRIACRRHTSAMG